MPSMGWLRAFDTRWKVEMLWFTMILAFDG